MNFQHQRRLTIKPAIRLDTRRGSLGLTTGGNEYRRVLAGLPRYWKSSLPGVGLFRREMPEEVEPIDPAEPAHEEEVRPLHPHHKRGHPFDLELAKYLELHAFWKNVPHAPTHSEFASVRQPQDYRPLRPQPEPDWPRIRTEAIENRVRALGRMFPWSMTPRALRRLVAANRLGRHWPEFQRAREDMHRQVLEDFAQLEPGDRAAWPAHEQARVQRLARLLDNDTAETFACLCETVESLYIPFDTSIHLRLAEPSVLLISLELPEIENVVQQTSRERLRSGDFRKVKRDKEEQHREYMALVIGQAIHVAFHCYAATPFLQNISVAGFLPPAVQDPSPRARRQRGRDSESTEAFLFEIPFEREDVDIFNPETFEAMKFLTEHGARFSLVSNIALGRIDPPSWHSRETEAAAPQR